jgi:hypothetical protein
LAEVFIVDLVLVLFDKDELPQGAGKGYKMQVLQRKDVLNARVKYGGGLLK